MHSIGTALKSMQYEIYALWYGNLAWESGILNMPNPKQDGIYAWWGYTLWVIWDNQLAADATPKKEHHVTNFLWPRVFLRAMQLEGAMTSKYHNSNLKSRWLVLHGPTVHLSVFGSFLPLVLWTSPKNFPFLAHDPKDSWAAPRLSLWLLDGLDVGLW